MAGANARDHMGAASTFIATRFVKKRERMHGAIFDRKIDMGSTMQHQYQGAFHTQFEGT